MDYIERGWPDERIGRALGCSAEAINLARKRYGIPSRIRTCLTGHKIARLLGFRCSKSITRWIEAGWLRGRRGWQHGLYRTWVVDEGSLMAFLGDPAHWHRWDPERITEPGLRQWAIAQRQGERFLTHTEVAKRLFVQRGSVNNWIRKGLLPTVRNGRGNHLIRESDLRAFTLPRLGKPKARWDPCAACGDADGPIKKPSVTPWRATGRRFGIEGKLCARCYTALRNKTQRHDQPKVMAA